MLQAKHGDHTSLLFLHNTLPNIIDRLLNGDELHGIFIQYLAIELFLQRQHQFHHSEGIRSQIIGKGAINECVFPILPSDMPQSQY